MAGTPLTNAINALTTYSNTVTGASDTTLSEAVATLASGYGGGGSSPVTVIDTITVSAQRAVQIDITADWDGYDFIIVAPNVTMSASDWLYLGVDSTSGSLYTSASGLSFDEKYSAIVQHTNTWRGAWFGGNINAKAIPSFSSYLYFYTYTASKKMTGTFTVYGVKF